MPITSQYRQDGEVLVIKVGEKFDFSKVEEFRNAYSELTDNTNEIAVDLSITEFMDSSALGMLLNMQKSLKGGNYTYSIENARPQVSKILEISRFDKKFKLR